MAPILMKGEFADRYLFVDSPPFFQRYDTLCSIAAAFTRAYVLYGFVRFVRVEALLGRPARTAYVRTSAHGTDSATAGKASNGAGRSAMAYVLCMPPPGKWGELARPVYTPPADRRRCCGVFARAAAFLSEGRGMIRRSEYRFTAVFVRFKGLHGGT